MKTERLGAAAICGALMLVAATSVAKASTVYTYTGNNFINPISDATPPNGTYTTGMSVTGSFTVLNPLPANSPLTEISASLLSFSFSDGRNTITNLNATFVLFQIGTALGNINAWTIDILHNDPTYLVTAGSQSREIISASVGSDIGLIVQCITPFGSGCNIQADQAATQLQVPGTWSSVTTPNETPLPAALPLFAGGLSALGLLGWRRKRKQVA